MSKHKEKKSKTILTENSKQFLYKYLNTASPTGFESAGQRVWLDYIKPYIDDSFVDTYGTSKVNLTNGEIAKKVEAIFDMRPYFIEQRFNLRTPIYQETAAYGHLGRKCEEVVKVFNKGKENELKVKV